MGIGSGSPNHIQDEPFEHPVLNHLPLAISPTSRIRDSKMRKPLQMKATFSKVCTTGVYEHGKRLDFGRAAVGLG